MSIEYILPKKIYCELCDTQLDVFVNTTEFVEKWKCPTHGVVTRCKIYPPFPIEIILLPILVIFVAWFLFTFLK